MTDDAFQRVSGATVQHLAAIIHRNGPDEAHAIAHCGQEGQPVENDADRDDCQDCWNIVEVDPTEEPEGGDDDDA